MYQSTSAASDRRWAVAVGSAVVLFNLLVLPFAHRQLSPAPAFLPVILVALFCIQALTATLLLQQCIGGGGRSLAVLGAAYLYSCAIIIPLALSYPGAFGPHGVIPGTTQTATWLWAAWHIGSSLLVCAYALFSLRADSTRARSSDRTGCALISAGVLVAAVAVALFAMYPPAWSPTVIARNDYRALLTSGVGIAVWLCGAVALCSVVLATRGRSLLSLWLSVALLMNVALVTVTLAGGARFSAGWYVSQFESLLSAALVISALIRESGRMYASVLRNRTAALANAERIARLASWELDIETGRVTSSDSLFELFGLPIRSEPVDQSVFWRHIRHDDVPALEDALAQARRSGSFSLDHRIDRADGEMRWVNVQGDYVPARDGLPPRLIGTAMDVTERKQAEEALLYLAHHDSLTGLPNRVLLAQRMQAALDDAAGANSLVAVLVVDLDLFKEINDALGHAVGDRFLEILAIRLEDCAVRPRAFVARTGGDEFAFVAPVASVSEAHALAHEIVQTCRVPVHVAQRVLTSTASVGIAMYPADGSTTVDLLRAADTAMYQAKDEGRDRACFFTVEMHDRQINRLGIEGDLRAALARRELTVHYQPLIDARTGAVCGAEALARWTHPERGAIPPDDFIGIAESAGLIGALGRDVLVAVLRDHAACVAQTGLDMPFAINVSPRELEQPQYAAALTAALETTGTPPSRVTLELTEGAVINDRGAVLDTLRHLQALGIKIAIDDFGTGYSSLTRLRALPIDELKLDRSFVHNIADSSIDRAIAESVVRLGHSMNLRVVAEGVENEQQARTLRAAGCDVLQGYHFGRPMPIAEFVAYLEGTSPPVRA